MTMTACVFYRKAPLGAVGRRYLSKEAISETRAPLPSPSVSAASYCENAVRSGDREQYLCALFVPAQFRRSVFALRAFNVETARIRDNVSDMKTGQLRIQWWRDALKGIDKGTAPAHPIALELLRARERTPYSMAWMHRVLDGREKNLLDRGYRSMEELEQYAESTSSSLLYATLECMGLRDVHADHAASHIGKAHGIITALRATPFLAKAKRVYLPIDITTKFNVSQQDILRGQPTESVCNAVFDMASTAHAHVQKAVALRPRVPPVARSALSPPAIVCLDALERLGSANFDVFHPSVGRHNPLIAWKLAWRSWWGDFS